MITTVRRFPPKGGAATRPGMDVNDARTYTLARSISSLFDRVSLDSTNCPTGNVDASKRMINGGCEPGGKIAWMRLANALNSAAACAMFVPG